MERSPFMMWSKRRPDASNPIYDGSWEEQAFVEDAAGGLDGCIWPQRSYSCSFCSKEFRSAQALGGHMNVHRRDRARLKQSPNPNHGILHHTAHLDKPSRESISPQIHQLFHNPSPKPGPGAAATPISPSEVPRCPVDGGRIEHGKIPPYLSSFQGEFGGRLSGSVDFVPSRSNPIHENCCGIRGSKGGSEKNDKSSLDKQGNHGYKSRSDLIEWNFLMSLSLATQAGSCLSDDEEEEEDAVATTTFHKRRRTDKPTVPLFLKGTLQSVVDVEELSDSVGEELDLELRLGGRPKGETVAELRVVRRKLLN